MAVPTHHSGSVYKHQGKNDWKESWLSLETTGKLTWKKKDAYEVKGQAYLSDVLDSVQVSGWPAKKAEQAQATPFQLRIPIEIRGSKKVKTLIVKSGADLDLWLDAFATSVGKWRLWKVIKQRQAFKISKQRSLDERSVEQNLKYEELVDFYKAAWGEFLNQYKTKGAGVEETNGAASQNGHTHHQIDSNAITSADNNRSASRQAQTSNGATHRSSSPPPAYPRHQAQPPQQQQQQQEHTIYATVHKHVDGEEANGGEKKKGEHKTNEVFGEEDDGEELHF